MKRLTASIVLLLFFLSSPNETFAQFKENNPKPGQYSKWAQKNYGHNGFKLNKWQRKALGLPNGFLGTGIGANKSRNKKKSNKQPKNKK